MHFQVKLETYTCPGLKKMYRVRVRGFKRNVLSETFVFVFGFRNLGGLGWAGPGRGAGLGRAVRAWILVWDLLPQIE